MASGLLRLDTAVEATPWQKSPPSSPVRSYYDSPQAADVMSTPPPGSFVDWEPGMPGNLPDLPTGQSIDFEAELLKSPLGQRFASPKGGLLVSLESDDATAAEPDETEQETDMHRLVEEYEQLLQKRAEAAEENEA
eukprot:TRINITY_DN33026_c0_g1_i1.p2 TRINITY_DN33026_c0_g1~~TRINITY_DN33026_c0_g1_i1.p2  ORF type:complete len:136 (+),score=45.65 TRINITY_DN33026_c0_g1_i1:66-473(+)